MAAQVKSVDRFGSVYGECIAHEKTKRGLGNRFHSAVVMLLNENPTATPEELQKMFLETLTEAENAHAAELTAEFGDDATPKDLSAWTQYKSNYKTALLKVDRRDILKCNGPYQLNLKLQEVRKALKEKEEGGASSDAAPGDNAGENGGGKAANTDTYEVSDKVHSYVSEALSILAQMDDDTAAQVAEQFKNSAAKRFRNMGNAHRKLRGVTGSSNKAAS